MPIAEAVKKFDGRALTVDAVRNFYCQKRNHDCGFPKWRVADNELLHKGTSFDERRAVRLLQERVNGPAEPISKREMFEVISGERDQLMDNLRQDLDGVMRASVGVEVIDVRVKKIDLPAEVSSIVYERMNSNVTLKRVSTERKDKSKPWRFAQKQIAMRWSRKQKPTVKASNCVVTVTPKRQSNTPLPVIRIQSSTSFIAALMRTARYLRIRAICWY